MLRSVCFFQYHWRTGPAFHRVQCPCSWSKRRLSSRLNLLRVIYIPADLYIFLTEILSLPQKSVRIRLLVLPFTVHCIQLHRSEPRRACNYPRQSERSLSWRNTLLCFVCVVLCVVSSSPCLYHVVSYDAASTNWWKQAWTRSRPPWKKKSRKSNGR